MMDINKKTRLPSDDNIDENVKDDGSHRKIYIEIQKCLVSLFNSYWDDQIRK